MIVEPASTHWHGGNSTGGHSTVTDVDAAGRIAAVPRELRAEAILVVIYLGGSTLILPMAETPTLRGLPTLAVALLIGSALLTAASYLTFAQALQHIEASRIGVLVALTPVFVVINMELLTALWPGLLPPENRPPTSLIGGLVVIAGSILAGWRRS